MSILKFSASLKDTLDKIKVNRLLYKRWKSVEVSKRDFEDHSEDLDVDIEELKVDNETEP